MGERDEVRTQRVVALAGGVGGSKLAHGLYATLAPDQLQVVVNTADDFEHFGLRICPDADTVLYTLAGLANPATGWGVVDDTAQALAMLGRLGAPQWFHLGDRDLATHILRTERLRAGWTLTDVLAAFTEALGVHARLLPMCDEPVATHVRTPEGELSFQDYFVRRHHSDQVLGLRLAGIEQARVTPSVMAAVRDAEALVFCPSNPLVSIGPILAVPGMRTLLAESDAVRVAVCPLVGGHALRGPADRMLSDLGHQSTAFGVASLYRDLLHGMVIDVADAAEATAIEALGLAVLVTQTVMQDDADRARLAEEVLHFAARLRTAAGTGGRV